MKLSEALNLYAKYWFGHDSPWNDQGSRHMRAVYGCSNFMLTDIDLTHLCLLEAEFQRDLEN